VVLGRLSDHFGRRPILLLSLSGAAIAMAYAGTAMAASHGHDHGHGKHDHSKHSSQMPDLLDAVNVCLDKGQRCISHCLVTFMEGDTELAACAAKVNEMHAVCDAFSYLVTANSRYVKAYGEVCAQVCMDCEKECLKHDKHEECKACAKACADCREECERVVKAAA